MGIQLKLGAAGSVPYCESIGSDNNMINIHNDCIAYPEYVPTQISSCDDSRLISYMIARGLLE